MKKNHEEKNNKRPMCFLEGNKQKEKHRKSSGFPKERLAGIFQESFYLPLDHEVGPRGVA